MSELLKYGKDDEYLEIYQIGKNGWQADFQVRPKMSGITVIINGGTWQQTGTGISEAADIYVEADSESYGSFTLLPSSGGFKEYTAYYFFSSYEVFIDGESIGMFGFGFSFETTSRYEAGALYAAPDIISITEFDSFAYFGILVQLNTFATYCDHSVFITLTDSAGKAFEFDDSTVSIFAISGDLITYGIQIKREHISYGKVSIELTVAATEKNDSNGDGVIDENDFSPINSEATVLTRFFHFNSLIGEFRITAEEWNCYNEAFAAAIADSGHGLYGYSEVIRGQEMTLDLLCEPIHGYYDAFGWYYGDCLPRSTIHYGKIPDGVSGITAYDFFIGLEDMLNSFYI